MILYSINDLENLTGIKAQTIRVWEKRYNTIKPMRTETNIRCYDDDDLKRLINISSLIKSGMKISEVSKLNNNKIAEEINKRINIDKLNDLRVESVINQMINAVVDFNEIAFDKLLSGVMLRMGIPNAYRNVLIPLLNRVGLLWSTNALDPSHEHFVSNLVRQKLFSVIDSLPPPDIDKEGVILFLPDFEDHEIGLLVADYLLRQSGRKTIYLGQRVPLAHLRNVVTKCQFNQLLFFIIQTKPINLLQDYIEQVGNAFPDLQLFLSGNKFLIGQLQLPENIFYLKNPESLIDEMIDKSSF